MSPIISNARNAAGVLSEPPPASRSETSGDAAAQFEGMLFASALAPLSQALGVLGDVLTNAVATAVARGSHDELYRHLQTLADAAESDGRK